MDTLAALTSDAFREHALARGWSDFRADVMRGVDETVRKMNEAAIPGAGSSRAGAEAGVTLPNGVVDTCAVVCRLLELARNECGSPVPLLNARDVERVVDSLLLLILKRPALPAAVKMV